MRPLSISSRTPIPVIPYVSNGVGQTLILHTQANNYRCKNEGCPCHAEAERRAMEGDTGKMATMEREREWGSPPRVTHVDRSTGDELHDRIRALRLPDYPQVRIHTYILGTFSTETRIVVYLADRPIFTMVMVDREELKAMLEDGSLVDLLTKRTTYFLEEQQEAQRRAMEGDTGKMARMEREWGNPPWRRP